MTLECLQNEMKNAMKANNTLKRDVLRSAIAAIKKVAIDERKEADEAMVDRVLLKEAKTIQEQIDTCPENRVDLRMEYDSKLTILNEYVPKLETDPVKIRSIIDALIAAADIVPTKANKGAVMKAVMPHLKGKADMKIVNQVITEVLV